MLVGNVNTIPEHGKIHVRVVDYLPANYTQAGMSFVSFNLTKNGQAIGMRMPA
ncbi:MAG TPA: hypothetical protein VE959_21920 [Bryobacteraceae bacterium]|nr:hypothetical protein [Bryobacteraceae bacterium]